MFAKRLLIKVLEPEVVGTTGEIDVGLCGVDVGTGDGETLFRPFEADGDGRLRGGDVTPLLGGADN